MDQKRKIVFERINSMFEINKEELGTLINPDLLSNQFNEFPPIMPGNLPIGTAIALSGNDPAGILQQMYLYTYHLGGRVKFGYFDSLNKYYIYFNFSNQQSPQFLNRGQNTLVVNGEGGLRFFKLIQVSSIGSLKLIQMPSLTLIILKDNVEVFKQSLMTMVSAFQYNSEVAHLNKSFDHFDRIEVMIIDLSEKHDYNCVLSFE